MIKDRTVSLRLLASAEPKTPLYGYPALGFAAATAGTGFRNDGSYLYENHLADFRRDPRYRDRERPPVVDRIVNNRQQFRPVPGLNPKSIDLLIAALTALRDTGVEVHTFLPPFSSEAVAALDVSETHGGWWREYRQVLPARLEEKGIPCVVVASPDTIDLDDRYMLDGFHAGEVLTAHILELLVRKAPENGRLSLVNIDVLIQNRKETTKSPLSFDPVPLN